MTTRALPTRPPSTTRRPSRPPTPPRAAAAATESIFGTPLTSSAYDPGSPSPGDQFVLVSLEQAQRDVDQAINQTVSRLFDGNGSTTPAELLRLFRYPAHSERGVARAAEIFQRTLELVAAKVKDAVTFDVYGSVRK